MTFVRNHAQGILACDFFVSVTASFRLLHAFVVMEVGTRRIAHFNVSRLANYYRIARTPPGRMGVDCGCAGVECPVSSHFRM
jgi:hypothetical protein